MIAVVVRLFGRTRLPKLAPSLGSAKAEFEPGTKGTPVEPTTTVVVTDPPRDQRR